VNFTGANRLLGDRPGVIDGHAHVFEASLTMAPDRRYTPKTSALLTHYVEHLVSNGMSGALLVQPSFLGNDNQYLIDAIQQANQHAGLQLSGVAVVEPESSEPELARLASAGVVGFRLNLLGGEVLPDLARWASVIEFAQANDWHVELHCEGARLPALLDMLGDRSLRIVVDHFGLPDPNAPLSCRGLRAIADMPQGQVFVKLSAPYRVFRDVPSETAMRLCLPIVDLLLNSLGPEQLLWGSDWPWTQFERRHTYADTVSWRDLMSRHAE